MTNMKKKFIHTLFSVAVIFSAVSPVFSGDAQANSHISGGSVFKGRGHSAIYYLGSDGQRYVFPNDKVYFSWYSDFNNVIEVNDNDLSEIALAGNVRYRPGVLLVKVPTDPKVYAVENGGKLRWVQTEALAHRLYGEEWNRLVDDLPVEFFATYVIGDPIEEEEEYDPVEVEEKNPTIDNDIMLRAENRISKRVRQIEASVGKMCLRLERQFNKLRARAERWGIEWEQEGFFEGCTEPSKDKITVCHIPPGNPENAVTIEVSESAADAHIAHGDTLGACEDEDDDTGDPEDTTPPVISDVTATPSTTTALIEWSTDEASSSEVEYALESLGTASTTEQELDASLVTSHSIMLSGLTASTTYYFVVKSEDASGNFATSTEMMFTTTLEPKSDTTPPVFSGIGATIGATSTVIIWSTDEESTSKVTFANETLATASTTTSVFDASLVTSHSITLTGLATSTEYFFVVTSADAEGNTATSTEASFITLF